MNASRNKSGNVETLARTKHSLITKITILVATEITVIVISLGLVAYYESQSTLIGNSINIAGRDRYLTTSAVLEAEKYLDGLSSAANVSKSIGNLNRNIVTLRAGGNIDGLDISSLPEAYIQEWHLVNKTFYEFAIIETATVKSNLSASPALRAQSFAQIEETGNALINQSNTLVSQMSYGDSQNARALITAQIILLILKSRFCFSYCTSSHGWSNR